MTEPNVLPKTSRSLGSCDYPDYVIELFARPDGLTHFIATPKRSRARPWSGFRRAVGQGESTGAGEDWSPVSAVDNPI